MINVKLAENQCYLIQKFLNKCKDFTWAYEYIPHLIKLCKENMHDKDNFFIMSGINDNWHHYINLIKEESKNDFNYKQEIRYKRIKAGNIVVNDYVKLSNVSVLFKYLTIYKKLYNLQYNSDKEIYIRPSYVSYSSLTGQRDYFDSFFPTFSEYVIHEENIGHELGHILLNTNNIFLPKKLEEGLVTLMIEPYDYDTLYNNDKDFDKMNNGKFCNKHPFYQIVISYIIMNS